MFCCFFFFFCYRALLNLLPIFCFLMQVLPSLREKHDEFMLRELVKRWANHKVMVRWLSRFFHYLDRYFIARRSLPPLNEVGLACFRNQVCHGWLPDSCAVLYSVCVLCLWWIFFSLPLLLEPLSQLKLHYILFANTTIPLQEDTS